MKEKKRKPFLLIAGVLIVVLFIAAATAASVFAYRQLTESGDDNQKLSFSSNTGRLFQDEADPEKEVSLSDKGVLVTGVKPDSPAAEAGIRRGSIILLVDGVEVNNPRELSTAIGEHEGGDSVVLSVLNCDSPEDLSVTLASAGPMLGIEIAGHRARAFGFSFGKDFDFDKDFDFEKEFDFDKEFEFEKEFEFGEEFPFFHGMPHDLDPYFPGIPGMPRHFDDLPDDLDFMSSTMVLDVLPDSPAEKAGLVRGDIIEAIDGQEVENSEEIVDQILSKQPGDVIDITVSRDDETVIVAATLEEHPEEEGQAHLGIFIGSVAIHREIDRFENEQNS